MRLDVSVSDCFMAASERQVPENAEGISRISGCCISQVSLGPGGSQ